MEEKIYELALQGKTNGQIAEELKINSEEYINKTIYNLKTTNEELYNQILLERDLTHRKVIDKDLLEDIKELNRQNFTKEEMAHYLNQPLETIQSHIAALKTSSIYKDIEEYKKIQTRQKELENKKDLEACKKIENLVQTGYSLNTVDSKELIQNLQLYPKIREMLEAYLDANMQISDEELSKQFKFASDIVKDILNGNAYRKVVKELIGEEMFKEMIDYRKKNYSPVRAEIKQEFTEEEKASLEYLQSKQNFWIALVLTFRLSKEDLAWFIKFPKDSDIRKMDKFLQKLHLDPKIERALQYLFLEYAPAHRKEAEKRRKDAKDYIMRLNKTANNKEETKKVLGEIYDVDFQKLVKSGKKSITFTEQDWDATVKYYLKYALTEREFPYGLDTLTRNCPEYLKEDLQNLKEYNVAKSQMNHYPKGKSNL